MNTSFIQSSKLLEHPSLRISTGCGVLDGLLGRIEAGRTYLFYGDEEVLRKLLYGLAVNSLIELEKPVLVLTMKDYHAGLIFDTYDLGYTAVQYFLDPEYALKNVYVATVFNRRQVANIKEIVKFVRKKDIKVILVWATTDLFEYEDYTIMIKFLGSLKQALETDVALVFFSRESKLSKTFPPKPDGPVFFKHFANVIVYFRLSMRNKRLVKIYLVKHPYRRLKEVTAYLDYHGLVDL